MMRKIALLVALLLLAIAVVPGAAQDDMALPDFIQHTECEVDLTGETITIYHIGDISGSYAPITQPLLAAFQDAMTYFNERGGVCGATFAQENRDTGGDPAQTQAAYDAFSTLDPKPDLIVLYSSQDSELLRPQVAEDEIPVLISAGSLEGLYGENGDAPGWIFATNPLYADQMAHFCQYVSENPDQFAEEPTLGYIGWGAPLAAFGQAAYTPEAIEYCESVGVSVVDPAEAFSPVAADVSTNIENLYDAGANIIYVNALATGTVRVAEAIHFLELQDELQLATVNWGMDTSAALVARSSLGANGLPVLNGMIGSLPFGWWTESDNPAIQLVVEQADANERALPVRGITYLLGWMTVDLYAEVYIQTANRVGSLDAITGADILETLEGISYSPMTLSTTYFDGGESRAARSNRLVQMRFVNATMDGVATSGEDALAVPLEDGTNYYPPVIIPLTDFEDAPDMRPGM